MVDWFKQRRAEKTVSTLRRHLSLVTGAVDCLEDLYKAFLEGDEKAVEEIAKRIIDMEEEADSLRRVATRELSMGILSPSIREDLMQLVLRIDDIMDWITATVRIACILPTELIPMEMKDLGARMVEATKKCVWALRRCVNRLYEKPKEAMRLAAEVERYEHDVDTLWTKVKSSFVKVSHDRLPIGAAIMTYEFFLSIERVSDRCEDASDIVSMLAIRYE